jgi:hypothetical protein
MYALAILDIFDMKSKSASLQPLTVFAAAKIHSGAYVILFVSGVEHISELTPSSVTLIQITDT